MPPQVDFSALAHFTEKQKEARRAAKRYKYVFYGGTMGPGKSYWLRWQLLDFLTDYGQMGLRGVRVGLFCEDYPALRDRHISRIKYEFPEWLGTMNESAHEFVLYPEYGSGVVCFRNLDDPSKYKSSEFAVIAVDELTKNTRETFDFLRTRMRWVGIEQSKFIAASNPGEVGHQWVKSLWIDKIYDENEQEKDQFYFIRALPTDNPYLPQSYYTMLDSLPEKMRKAYKDGNWDVFEGQYFTEFDRTKHIIEPYDLPDYWPRFRSIDPSGRSGITSCHWYCVDHDGNVIVYREYYRTGLDADQHAENIKEMSEDEDYKYTVIDNAAFSKLGLPETIVEVFERHGVTGFVPSSKKRVMGWNSVHTYLRWDKEQEPRLRIFSNCTELIRTLPLAFHDKLHPDDIDTDCEDHALDELRYFLQTIREQKTPKPLTLVEKKLFELKQREEDFNFNYARRY